MWTIVALLAVEILLLAVFAPIKVEVQAYFCLERGVFLADIKIFRLTVAKIRAKLQHGKIILTVNNKRMPLKPSGKQSKRMSKVAKYVLSGNLAVRGDMLAVVGSENSMIASLVSTTICVIGNVLGQNQRVYDGYSTQRTDVQLAIKSNISVFQTVEMMIEK